MGVLIRCNYGTCDSCGKADLVNVIYVGNVSKGINVTELDLCDNCLFILHNFTKPDETIIQELKKH